MTILELPRPLDDERAHTLRRLELTVTWLWSCEPTCDIDERQHLLARLSDASTSIDLLVLHHEVRPDSPLDHDQVAASATEIDNLTLWWPEFGTVHAQDSRLTKGRTP